MLTAAALSVFFLILGLWKGRHYLAIIVAVETLISTGLTYYSDNFTILFSASWVAVYSLALALCVGSALISAAYAILIFYSIINFAITAIYATYQTTEMYYASLVWFYTYWPVFVVSVGLIVTGLVKNDRNGTRSTDNHERFSHHSEYLCNELDGGYARHAEKVYKRV